MNAKTRRAAFVDIGTNTVLLLVVEIAPDLSYQILEDHCEIARLGQGMHASDEFSGAAMQRVLAALQRYQAIAASLDCDYVKAVGTAAFRKARNATAFLAQIQDQTGFAVEIISGVAEAQAIAAATRLDFADLPKPFLTIDIGGGSTEFILSGAAAALDQFFSLPFGVVRLTERFLTDDPPSAAQHEKLRHFVAGEIQKLKPEFLQMPKSVVATAGTPTTLSAILQNLKVYDSEKVHRSILTSADIQALLTRLAALPLAQRQTIPCLPAGRADMIVAGCLILQEVLLAFGFDKVSVSDRGLRFGLLNDYLKTLL